MSDPRPPSSIFDIIGDILRQAALKKAQEAAYGIAGAFGSGQTNLPEGLAVGPLDVGAATNLLTHVTRPDLYGDTTPVPSTAERAGEPGFPLTFPAPLGGNNAPIYDLPVLGGVLKQFQYQGQAGTPSPWDDLGPIPFATPETTAAEQTLAALTGKAVGKAGSAVAAAAKPQAVAAAGKDIPKPSQAILGEAGELTPARYQVEVGKSRTLIRDTQTGETLPTIFGGKNQVEQATAEATRRNAPIVAQAITKKNGLEAIPADDPLRKLTSDQLGVLRRVPGVSKADKKAIDALLAERAFTVAPEDQLKLAVNDVPRAIQSQVRKALRSELGDNLTPEELIQAPGIPAVLDGVLAGRKIPVNIANRKALAQELIDKALADNVANLQRQAHRLTGDPVADGVLAELAHVDGDARAGAPAIQTFEDTIDAIMRPVLAGQRFGDVTPPDMAAVRAATAAHRAETAATTLTPEQQAAADAVRNAPVFEEGQQSLLPREGVPGGSPPPGGGSNLPPTDLVPKPQPPLGKRVLGFFGGLLKSLPGVFQGTRGVAGGDFSATASQTFPVLFKQPISYVKGNLAGWLDTFKDRAAFLAEQLKYKHMIEATGVSAEVEKGGLLSSIGGNVVSNEGLGASVDSLRRVIPALERVLGKVPVVGKVLAKGVSGYSAALQRTEQAYVGTINAVRTYSYLGALKFYESKWAYDRALSLAEKQKLMENIRVLTGRGYTISKDTPEMVVHLAKIAQGAGFSPQLAVARARLIVDTPKAVARILWDTSHGRAPLVQDVDVVRGATGYVASVVAMWGVARAAGLNIDTDMDSSRFGLIDLGKPGPDKGPALAAAEFLGLRSQAFGGHVYIDPGQGVGQDLKLLFRIVGPLFGKLPRDQKGNAWNPWSPKGTDSSVMDLLVAFAENKLLPGFGVVAQTASGHAPDMADITQNPVTALSIPLWVQGGLAASGETAPGGGLYSPALGEITTAGLYEPPTQAEIEKKRLSADLPRVPGMTTLSGDRQKQFDDRVNAAVRARIDALITTPQYLAADDAEKKRLIDSNTATVGRATRRSLALEIATTGAPNETVPAAVIALNDSPSNLEKGETLVALDTAGRLTQDVTKQLDALRKNTDNTKPDYDPNVIELVAAKRLADSWLAAPEFEEGTKADWDLAAATAAQLRRMRTADERRGIDPKDDDELVRFYDEQGGPLFTEFYTFAGQKKPNAVGEVRKAIQKNPLWRFIATSASKRDHPGLP